MNYAHLLIALVITGWVLSVEYRLWANLRIWGEEQKKTQKRGDLHAVGK